MLILLTFLFVDCRQFQVQEVELLAQIVSLINLFYYFISYYFLVVDNYDKKPVFDVIIETYDK